MNYSVVCLSCVALVSACCVEPPRVYGQLSVIHEESTTPPHPQPITVSVIPAMPFKSPAYDPAKLDHLPEQSVPSVQQAINCADIVCGDFTISGTLTASSFVESPPVIVDGLITTNYSVPGNVSTVLVYPYGTIAVSLPTASDNAGRIVRVKVMGVGPVDVKAATVDEVIDGMPSYFMQGIGGAALPSVTLQAYYEQSGNPADPPHKGWAVIAVTP